MLERARRLIARLSWMTTGGLLVTLLTGLALIAQQPTIGVFSRIYMGGTGTPHCEIRWGSTSPLNTVTAVGCALFMQTASGGADSTIWYNLTGPSSAWVKVANQKQIGDTFYAKQFGAVCDGATDDTAALQATVDAAYNLANKAGTVILPAGVCNTSGLVVGPITTPWQVSPNDPLNLPEVGIAFTSGDQTHFEITDGVNVLQPGHVGNSMTWVAPLTLSTIAFDGTPFSPTTPSLFTGRWAKYFTATITSRIDATHGTMSIQGIDLNNGSLRVNQFPDLPHANNCINLPSGVPGDGCTSSYWCHEHAHLVAGCGVPGTSAVLDGLVDYAFMATYQSSHPGLAHLYPYAQPSDTSARFISLKGASDAVTGLRWIGNTSGTPALIFSRNKYFRMDDIGIINGTSASATPAVALAGSGAGNVTNGVHNYRVACQQNLTLGTWSDAVAVTVANNAVNGQVNVTGVAACTNGTARLIYRTKAGATATAGPYYLLTTIANNTTTVFLDNVADGSLSATTGFPKGNSIGMYLGGLPAVGAQTLEFRITKVSANGFHLGTLLGDNLGGETSDGTFNQLAGSDNDICVNTGGGSFNTLDIYFNQLNCSINRVGVKLHGGGSFYFNDGGSSFNGVDFWGAGSFGPVVIKGWRSEGTGRFFYGAVQQLSIYDSGFAEPSGARAITGNVTATPDNTRTESINVTSTTCPNHICPITFTAGDLLAADVQKVIFLPAIGTGGADVVASITQLSSTTAGSIQILGNTQVATTGAVTATIYQTNTLDLVWPSGQVVANDVGAAIGITNGGVTGAWSNTPRVYVQSFLSATTGKGSFIINGSANGGGPIIPAGATTANPTLFDNTAIEITDSEYNIAMRGVFVPNGMIKVNACGAGSVDVQQSTIYTPDSNTMAVQVQNPYTNSFVILPDSITPVSNSIVQLGVQYAGSFATTSCGGAATINTSLHTLQTRSQYFAGPTRYLGDFTGVIARNVVESLITFAQPTAGTITGNFYGQNYPSDPVAPQGQYSRVKQLSESGFANGHNLRMTCAFATSDTSTCTFQRNETYTYNSNGTGGTTSDPNTSTYRLLVTSGHFTQADVGKIIKLPGVGGNVIASGGVDKYAIILAIVDATHIDTRDAFGNVSGFPSGTSTGTAVVGQDEPDALWLPALWGCSGLDTGTPEIVTITSHTASQVVLTSSKATSTASCLVGVIR